MINFFPAFLDARTNQELQQRVEKLKPELSALQAKFKDNPSAYPQAERELLAQHPIFIASYTRIVDHIDHIKKIAGIDHVGLGSDYDGIPMLPAGMQGMEDLALVSYEMLRRGYTEIEVKKVLGENFLRAFTQAEKIANVRHRTISGEGSLSKLPK
jgi:membrane dipeptidase